MSKEFDIKVAKLFLLTSYGHLIDQSCSVNRRPVRTVFCHYISTFLSRRSLTTSSSHVILGLPILLLPSGLLSNIFLTSLPRSNLTTCPIQSKFFFVMSATVSKSLYTYCNSWSVLILHIPRSTTDPCILLKIFLSRVFNLFIPISVMGHVSILM